MAPTEMPPVRSIWNEPQQPKTKSKPFQTALQKAETFAFHGREIAASITDAIHKEKPYDVERLAAYAERVRLCSANGNIWKASDLHTFDGELYEGTGRFWTCGHKLCPYCSAQTSRRRRRVVREAVSRQVLRSGQYFKFLTLTIQNPDLSLLQTRDLVYRAWSRFRKLKWFKETIIGAAKGEEFTLTRRGYHYHIHLLAITKYVNYHSFRHYWTECVRDVFTESGLEFSPATADKMLIANCKNITSREAAINEVSKYITKTDSWKKLNSSHLLDIARTRRFPRMSELIGSFRPPRQEPQPEPDDALIKKTIVHTTSITDGSWATDWRDEVDEKGVVAYISDLADTAAERANFRTEQLRRKYQFAVFDFPYKTEAFDPEPLIARLNSIADAHFDENPTRKLYRYTSTGLRYRA